MSIFTKPLSQLATSDLQELLSDGAVENIRLEFKVQGPSRDETLKKLSSFANTFGGLMVIGAKANSADGRIQDLPGVDVESGYKQKVVQWCFDGASPPLVVEVSDPISVPTGNNKVCYVVYAAESDVAPHFLNGRKGIWVRTDEFSARFDAHLADETELRHLFDRRRLVTERRVSLLERARKRFHTYATQKHTDRGGNAKPLSSVFEFSIVPRFPARPLCQQEQLKALIQTDPTLWRQVFFPDPGSPMLSQHESAIVLNAARGTSIFEVNVWGLLFFGVQIDRDHNATWGIYSSEFVGYLLLFIEYAGKALHKLGYSGPIMAKTVLTGVLHVPWLYPQDGGAWLSTKSGSELDDDVAFPIPTTSEALREKPDAVAMDLLRYVLFSVNSSETVDTPQKVENLIRQGYLYNSWRMPASLRV